ncbi:MULTISPECIES: hypothetical protein [Streptomyces]|uniref:hypothetical protein n=1 Tax=Streptomyces TaxID=1883 RepID=UPI00163C6F5A|nr:MULTISPECIES: hypothetical protein [Streptomyces]MBC2875317.1 hypothetical protein [Streptomyces sp. TYQ1024]UBI37138.1 hypothetical protein K7I03_12135 [Streptomyces mobaraensis]UKW29733.1 hypothetical protein MCU78_12110 [Streptomyces sp. TYQ1024]
MASHARHAFRPSSRLARPLVRTGLTLTAGAAIAVTGATEASAHPHAGPSARPAAHPSGHPSARPGSTAQAQLGPVDLAAAAEGARIGLQKSVEPLIPVLRMLPVNPLARTGSDPLNNAVGTQVGDFKPVSTRALTGSLSDGGKVQDLPGLNMLPR